MANKCLLTVFTPTYNRAYLLPQLYKSLESQSCKNFIWLIIDDGSSDGTVNLVNSWIKENKITIKYFYKENGGKNTAIEKANEICSTEFICTVDSDDFLSNEAIEILYSKISIIEKDKNINGVVARIMNKQLKPLCDKWVDKEKLIYFPDLYTKYGYSADTFLLFRTDIIKKFHFPVFKDERFVTEAVYYNKFVYDYPMLAINEMVSLCEYMPDGYTNQGINLFLKNPKGYLYFLKNKHYIARKHKGRVKELFLLPGMFYGWKLFFKLKNDYPCDYKFPVLYKIIGFLLSPAFYLRYKIKYGKKVKTWKAE